MIGPVARISNQAGRSFMKTFVRNESHGGVPGENLPFDINNRYRLTLNFMWYVGTALGIPFLILRHNLKNNN